MQRLGIDTTNIQRVPTGTSGSVGLVSTSGERTFLHYIGANATPSDQWLRLTALPPARHLHIGGAFLLPGLDGDAMAHILTVAKRQGMTTSIDTAFDASGRWMQLLEPSLPFTDYFLPSQQEAAAIAQDSDLVRQARRFLDMGVKTYGVKLGEGGCFLASRSHQWTIPALPVAARDTTGAGDAWVAGFLAAQLQGWPLPASGLWGNALGAAVVEKIGAEAPIRNSEDLYRLLAYYGREHELQQYLSGKTVEGTVS
jgi:sugar/nucleoside kinase (ribokinase family)